MSEQVFSSFASGQEPIRSLVQTSHPLPGLLSGSELPHAATPLRILGVDYIHVTTEDGGDLYLTKFGMPYVEQLLPENWKEKEWFSEHRERLKGTSTVYKIPTRPVNGQRIDLVVKWCRVGVDVPLDTFTFQKFGDAEFNTPYEEFSLVMEMRQQPALPVIRTNRPLAIYVPAERLKIWETGRSESRISMKQAKFRDVELDVFRQYILIYEWVKGISADELFESLVPDVKQRIEALKVLTHRVQDEMESRGFMVVDHKPAHVILRPQPGRSALQDRSGEFVYALVDFELLIRTPTHERDVEALRRKEYFEHQGHRFERPPSGRELPDHLHHGDVLGVDYVHGHAESTHGVLWVVGRDPVLFDFYLPERWRRTPRKRLSSTNQTYYTLSKDSIPLVWKVSRVGETPDPDQPGGPDPTAVANGYNSPFEEVQIALELQQKGFSAISPCAIYMTGLESPRFGEYCQDDSRYTAHENNVDFEGQPVLKRDHLYLTLWEYWMCLDENPEAYRGGSCRGIGIPQACQDGYITEQEMAECIGTMENRLRSAGFEPHLKPSHYLLSLQPNRTLRVDDHGLPFVTISNFELLRRL